MTKPWQLTAAELAAAYADGALTPARVLEAVLGRDEDMDLRVSAIITRRARHACWASIFSEHRRR